MACGLWTARGSTDTADGPVEASFSWANSQIPLKE